MTEHGDGPHETVLTVFATVGTDHHRFDRLVGWIDRWAADHAAVRCLVQYGTSDAPRSAQGVAYMSKADQDLAMRQASVVVCHGGPATIADARRTGHVPIVVPRRAEFDEHVDDHQYRFSRHVASEKSGIVIEAEDVLRDMLDRAVADPAAFTLDDTMRSAESAVRRFSALMDTIRGPGRDTRVMYIGGFGRSGSTLLALLAGSLPGCVSVGELVFIWERGLVQDQLCGCGERFSECRYWRAVGERAFGGWDRVDTERALLLQRTVDRNRNLPLLLAPGVSPRYQAALREWCDSYLAPLYAAIAEVSGTDVIVDSSKHVAYAFLLRHVPSVDVRVVQLVRDPRGVAHSWSKQNLRTGAYDGELMPEYSATGSTFWWLYANSALRLLPWLGVPGDIVRYEDLSEHPARVLHHLAVLVDAPIEDGADFDFIDGHNVTLGMSHTVSGNPMRFDSTTIQIENDTTWIREMPRRTRQLVSAMAALMPIRKLRYPTRTTGSRQSLEAFEPPERSPGRPWPSVSAVISTRDRPELLERAIESIALQDYAGELEIVVVFDQSPVDESLAGTRHGRLVRTIRNNHTAGLPGGRNSGVGAAKGQLIAFCDDDDEWFPNKLSTQVALLEARPESGVATSGIVVRYATAEVARRPDRPAVTFMDLLKSRVSWVHPSTVLVRRDWFLNEIGGINEELPGGYGEDYEWLLRASQKAPIVAATQCLTRVNWHATSFFEARWQTIIRALTWLLRKYPDFRSEPAGLARIEGQIAFAHAAAGERVAAVKWALRAARHRPTEPRAALAMAVVCGVPAESVLAQLHMRGKGI